MEKSESTEDESLFLKIEGVLYEDLQELSVEDCTVSQEILGQRKSRLRTGRLVTVNKQQFALFKYKGIVYAVNERCPHMGGPLHLGDVEELGEARLPCVVCPWHSWKFSLQSGHLKVPHSKNVKLVTFPVRVDDKGQVFVGVKSLSPVYFSGEVDF